MPRRLSYLKSTSEPQQFPKVKFHVLNDLHGPQSSAQHAQRRPKVGVQLWSAAQPPPQINARLPEPNLNLWFCFSTFTFVFHCLSNTLEKLTQKTPTSVNLHNPLPQHFSADAPSLFFLFHVFDLCFKAIKAFPKLELEKECQLGV